MENQNEWKQIDSDVFPRFPSRTKIMGSEIFIMEEGVCSKSPYNQVKN
jgi:hypothetical protein